MSSWNCVGCQVNLLGKDALKEYNYMLKNEIWALTGLAPMGGKLCLGCLETRLKRPLTREDLTDAPINDKGQRRSERLKQRIG